MKHIHVLALVIVVLLLVVACSPARVSYDVVAKEQSNIPEDIKASVQVLLGHRGHLLNLRGYYVFAPDEYNTSDTYLWIHTDGRAVELKSVTEKKGVVTVVINEIDKQTVELDRYLLLKFPGEKTSFEVSTSHSNYAKQPELDPIVIEESRTGLAGRFVGLIDASSVEIQVNADLAWPGNEEPTVFRLSDEVKSIFSTLKLNDGVLFSFTRNKKGDLTITEATKTVEPQEQEEFSGVKATFAGLADGSSFEATFDPGQQVEGTVTIQMMEEVRSAVDANSSGYKGIKPGDKVILSITRNQWGQWVATSIEKP